LHARSGLLRRELHRLFAVLRRGRRGRRRLRARLVPARRNRLVLQRPSVLLRRAERLGNGTLPRAVSRIEDRIRPRTLRLDRGDRPMKHGNRAALAVPTASSIAPAAPPPPPTRAALATDVGVRGRSLSLGERVSSGRATVKSLQKDADVHLGATAAPAQLSGRLDVYFVDSPQNKAVLPLPAPWASSTPKVA